MDQSDPEVDNIEVSQDGTVTCEVRIVLTCADCGTDLKESTLEMSAESAFAEHVADCKLAAKDKAADKADEAAEKATDAPETEDEGEDEDHTPDVEETGTEATSRTEGKGRGTRTFYGAHVSWKVTCSCGEYAEEGEFSDDVQASSMDECC
jgi:hypothetical protein